MERDVAMDKIIVTAMWDPEAQVWVADSDDIGIATEAPSLDVLVAKLPAMIQDLCERAEPVPFERDAEIKRLRTQCGGNCRYWEGRWRDEAKLTDEAAAFLDEVANRLETEASPVGNQVAADICRHMANKLRA